MNRKTTLILICLLTAFFGYLAHGQFIHDETAAASSKIDSALVEMKHVNQGDNEKTSEYFGLKRAEIALSEYRKGVIETPRGCNCGGDVDVYTGGTHSQWCTAFASWVTHEAGSPVNDGRSNDWRVFNSRIFTEYLKTNGTFYAKEEIIAKGIRPQVGDYVVFWRGKPDDNLGHIDIVVELSDKNGRAGLVGGNLYDTVSYRSDYPYMDNFGFMGFGRPEKN